VTDLNYSFSDLEDQLDSTESNVSELLDDLEEDRSKVVEILEDSIGDVEDELDRVDEVYDSNSSKLRETIRGESKRLKSARQGAGEDEQEVRDRLARLYRELRMERREELENRLSLKMRKWDLERELEKLKGIDSI
jgi:vacuolar-type H+-ATPase subunit H